MAMVVGDRLHDRGLQLVVLGLGEHKERVLLLEHGVVVVGVGLLVHDAVHFLLQSVLGLDHFAELVEGLLLLDAVQDAVDEDRKRDEVHHPLENGDDLGLFEALLGHLLEVLEEELEDLILLDAGEVP